MGGDVPLESMLQRIEVGVAGGVQNKAPADGEWGVLRLSAMTSGRFTSSEAKRLASQAPLHQRFEVRDGDVLMVRVNGAQHLVGASRLVRGAQSRLVLSDLVFRLVPDETRLLPGFLALSLRTSATRQQIRRTMRGSSGQFQMPQSSVRALRIPNFPLDEQRRIVAAHAAFERRIAGLERVREKVRVAARATLASLLERSAYAETVVLKDALRRLETGWSPVCEPRLPAEDEWGVLKLSAVTSGSYEAAEAKALPGQILPQSRFEVKRGDVLMSRANGVKSLVGVVCTVGETRSRLLLPDLVFRLLADPDVLDQKFLGLMLSSEAVRRQIDDVMRGSSGQYKISKTDVQNLRVPCLALDEQRRVVVAQRVFEQRIEKITAQIDKLRTVQQAVVEDLLGGRAAASAA